MYPLKSRFVLVVVVLFLIPATTRGAILTANLSGVFSGGSSLGGTLLEDGTAFVMNASFDAQADLEPSLVTGLFEGVVEFNIDGFGTVQSDSTANVRVMTYVDDVYNGIGLANSDITSGFIAYYENAAPPFNPSLPFRSELSTFISSGESLPFTIALADGYGDLVIRGIEDYGDRASLSANPEPSTIAIWSLLGLAGLGYGWRKKRRAA
jgi:hypothetical protein